MENYENNCKVCNKESHWLCTDGEFYCKEHAPINAFQKALGYFCSFILLIGVWVNPKAYGR
jgi:hypothetical protein